MDKKNILPTLAISIVMLAIIINPSVYILAAQNGIILFGMTVLPALFPFFFFTKLLSLYQADIAIGNVLELPLTKIYNAPSSAGYIFTMSLMCGYPIGAKLIGDYYNQGLLDTEDSYTLAALASTSGPLFILGTLGSVILNNRRAGVIILISHYISAIVNGFLHRRKSKSDSLIKPNIASSTLRDSVYSAVISILIVGGYIIVFNIICDVSINIGVIRFISKLLPINKELIEGILLSTIEVTRGCMIIGKSSTNIIQMTATIAAAVTFGGLSVILQSTTFLESTGIKAYKFVSMKIIQCTIAYTVAFFLGLIFLR